MGRGEGGMGRRNGGRGKREWGMGEGEGDFKGGHVHKGVHLARI